MVENKLYWRKNQIFIWRKFLVGPADYTCAVLCRPLKCPNTHAKIVNIARNHTLACLPGTTRWHACQEPHAGMPARNHTLACLPRWHACQVPHAGMHARNHTLACLPGSTRWHACQDPHAGMPARFHTPLTTNMLTGLNFARDLLYHG